MEIIYIDGTSFSVDDIIGINRDGFRYKYYNVSGDTTASNNKIETIFLQDLNIIHVMLAMSVDFSAMGGIPTVLTKDDAFGYFKEIGININVESDISKYVFKEEKTNSNLLGILNNIRKRNSSISEDVSESAVKKIKDSSINSFSNDDNIFGMSNDPFEDEMIQYATENNLLDTFNTDYVKEDTLPKLLDYSDLNPNPFIKSVITEYDDNGVPILSSRKEMEYTVEMEAEDLGISLAEAINRRNDQILKIRESLKLAHSNEVFGAYTDLLEPKNVELGDTEIAKNILGY